MAGAFAVPVAGRGSVDAPRHYGQSCYAKCEAQNREHSEHQHHRLADCLIRRTAWFWKRDRQRQRNPGSGENAGKIDSQVSKKDPQLKTVSARRRLGGYADRPN